MAKSATKKKSDKATSKTEEAVFGYLSESVKNFDFADYVAIKSGPRGMLLSFGKAHPREEKFMIFSEILLPFEVAMSLTNIMRGQITELIEQGNIQVIEAPETKGGNK